MKTIITQEIDGYKVITALSDAAGFIDPVETKKAIENKIKETDTAKRIDAIHKQIRDLVLRGAKYKAEAKELFKLAKKNEANTAFQKFDDCWKEMKAFEPELKELFITLKSEYKDLMLSNAVYTGMKPNETLIEDAQAEEFQQLLSEAIPNGQLVTLDGKKVTDNRGRRYWKKSDSAWQMSEIYQLGKEPAKDEIWEGKLTNEQYSEIQDQLETERIASMNKTQKASEKSQREAAIRNQARDMSRDLEIAGDKEYVKKAQDWLAEKLAELDVIYG